MNNWVYYLSLNPSEYNCWTFVEKIYQDRLKVWDASLDRVYSASKTRWGDSVSFQDIDKLAFSHGTRPVTLSEIESHDILVFGVKDGRPSHFGVYIGNNQFIHLKKRPKIDELDEAWRSKLKIIYRYDNRI